MELNVLNFPDPATALARAVHGDRIYFPGTQVYQAPAGGWVIDKSLEIYGDGPGRMSNDLGTLLEPAGAGSGNHVFKIDPGSVGLDDVAIHDLCINGGGIGGDGIHLEASQKKLSQVRFHRLGIIGMGGAGISLIGVTEHDSDIVGVMISETEIENCGAEGIVLLHAFQVYVETTLLKGCGLEGIKAELSELAATVCRFDGNCGDGGVAQLLLDRCNLGRVDASSFENFATAPAIFINETRGVGSVGGCLLRNGGTGVQLQTLGIQGPVTVLPNHFSGVSTAIQTPDGAIACVVFPQYYDGTSTSPVVLPASSGASATLAVPGTYRPAGNKPSGLLLPALAGDPSSNAQGGTLARVGSAIRVGVGASPSFSSVKFTTAPAAIDSLLVGTVKGKTSLTVTWDAPAEPCWTGPVAAYDLRYSTAPIDDTNFASATPVPNTPAPASPGTPQCVSLTGLQSCRTYYFAIKSKDHSGQWSAISDPTANGKTKCTGSGEVDCL